MKRRQKSFAEEILFTPGYIPEEFSTLPGIAFQLKELFDDPDTTVCEVVSLLASDPAISQHIIRAANNIPDGTVDNLHDAVIKLGSRMVYGTIVSLALNQGCHASRPLIEERLNAFWERPQEIASRCYVLAHNHPRLKPETAMLIGLMH